MLVFFEGNLPPVTNAFPSQKPNNEEIISSPLRSKWAHQSVFSHPSIVSIFNYHAPSILRTWYTSLSIHQQLDCLFNDSLGLQQRKHQNSPVLVLFEGNLPPVTNAFPSQKPNNEEIISSPLRSIWTHQSVFSHPSIVSIFNYHAPSILRTSYTSLSIPTC